jgi:hypothetical protein
MKLSAIACSIFCITTFAHGQSDPGRIANLPHAELVVPREAGVFESNLAIAKPTPPSPVETDLTALPGSQFDRTRPGASFLEEQLKDAGLRALAAEQQTRDAQRNLPLLILCVASARVRD